MIIKIDDADVRKINIEDVEFCIKKINDSDFYLINTRECGVEIANQLHYREKINENDIDFEINDLMKDIHEKIYEEVIQVLESNGITIPYCD